ncbi:MAG: SGNH/GDSL hydrolase family protein [Kiritimatiellae bacterium]|nr:SGNH/GDSL hydrolase family protein [Kiritimatiellia bacterium]
MKIEDGQSILFTGDSITDCGRARPFGEGAGLGEGYVAFVDSLLAASYPERNIRVLNTGVCGNAVTNLDIRWQPDVLDLAPDWLSVMIGINDVGRQFRNPDDPSPVTIDIYEETYKRLLGQTRKSLKGLVLITPYLIEPDLSDPMRERMDEYGAVVKRLAGEFDAVFVDVQAGFNSYLAKKTAQSLCNDRVHPNKIGHMIIAKVFLKAIQFEWS